MAGRTYRRDSRGRFKGGGGGSGGGATALGGGKFVVKKGGPGPKHISGTKRASLREDKTYNSVAQRSNRAKAMAGKADFGRQTNIVQVHKSSDYTRTSSYGGNVLGNPGAGPKSRARAVIVQRKSSEKEIAKLQKAADTAAFKVGTASNRRAMNTALDKKYTAEGAVKVAKSRQIKSDNLAAKAGQTKKVKGLTIAGQQAAAAKTGDTALTYKFATARAQGKVDPPKVPGKGAAKSTGSASTKAGGSVKSSIGPTAAQKTTNAAIMYGTGSKQHRTAAQKESDAFYASLAGKPGTGVSSSGHGGKTDAAAQRAINKPTTVPKATTGGTKAARVAALNEAAAVAKAKYGAKSPEYKRAYGAAFRAKRVAD